MPAETKRLKVLISAYACEPNRGSEPGVGWNIAKGMAAYHDVCVVTRANNRLAIEEELVRRPVDGLRFLYCDLPPWARWWKRGSRGIQAYYYLWQFVALRSAMVEHRRTGFDVGHHVTFGRYWAPSFLAWMPVPYLWGPVGGGESTPKSLRSSLGRRGRIFERLRVAMRWLAEHDPLVRRTARGCRVALATTDETAARLRVLGVRQCHVMTQVALSSEECETLGASESRVDVGFRFVSIGNLLNWKGFHLGVQAFAQALPDGAEYWIVGDGPERQALERLAASLGVRERVLFLGRLPREQVLRTLRACSVLVHPSLHDSGGFVCLEAMAASNPVVCLDVGGPSVLVGHEAGVAVTPGAPETTIRELADAMGRLAADGALRQRLGDAGRRRACGPLSWNSKCHELTRFYDEVLRDRA